MNKYKVIYGYCHPNARLTHFTKSKICNTFDEAKKFINNLPETDFRLGWNNCELHHRGYHGTPPGKEPSNLYAKIRCEGKDFWIKGNSEEIWMEKGYIGSNNPIL